MAVAAFSKDLTLDALQLARDANERSYKKEDYSCSVEYYQPILEFMHKQLTLQAACDRCFVTGGAFYSVAKYCEMLSELNIAFDKTAEADCVELNLICRIIIALNLETVDSAELYEACKNSGSVIRDCLEAIAYQETPTKFIPGFDIYENYASLSAKPYVKHGVMKTLYKNVKMHIFRLLNFTVSKVRTPHYTISLLRDAFLPYGFDVVYDYAIYLADLLWGSSLDNILHQDAYQYGVMCFVFACVQYGLMCVTACIDTPLMIDIMSSGVASRCEIDLYRYTASSLWCSADPLTIHNSYA